MSVSNLTDVACFLVGGSLIVIGAFKLRKYFKKPGDEMLAPSLVRLLIGGLIVGLPFLLKVFSS